ncbi:VOC family protein [Amycolatopsis thermoflava]|uniref:VOC family protein n=1 Tax=Amycolatopsis thermoflava TaxID=84480 RepID=UPI003EC11BF2
MSRCRRPTGRSRSGRRGSPQSVEHKLVIDCADPDRQARFWAAAAGLRTRAPPRPVSTPGTTTTGTWACRRRS